MFKVETVELKHTGAINSLVLDYLEKKEPIKKFYAQAPDKEGFAEILEKNLYSDFNRSELVEVLLKQANLVKNPSAHSLRKIQSLNDKCTYTITTGHQLCLFTGPLYFIYKIFSTINLAEELKSKFPNFDFVPVYWMASEDHDFDEVNYFTVFNKNFQWQSKQTGAVGNFKTNELTQLLNTIKQDFGTTDYANYLSHLFEEAYLKHSTLKDATRFLVNELFGSYGLVTVDGDDTKFKNQFKHIFEKDIFENDSYKYVKESTEALSQLGYVTQVNARQINCFYLENNTRARIDKVNDKYNVVGTEYTFTASDLKNIVKNTPEKISANVVLRPVYQQYILPNIAYVGGPGELAYWLQFKKMFDELDVVFPILMPRNFITLIDAPTKNKIEKLNFIPIDFFNSAQELIKAYQLKTNNVFNLDNEKDVVSKLYNEVSDKISLVDKTLNAAASAEFQKVLNGLDLLVGKANKALKQRSETEINQINSIKQKFFPNNIPQERSENFSGFYLKYGADLFKELKEKIKPFEINHKIFIEIKG